MRETLLFPSSILPSGARGAFRRAIRGILVVVAIVSVNVGPIEYAYGDGSYSGLKQQGYRRPTTRQYNDRLPPVMPGEEIVTETGQKMKTWSSSGPVPVNRRPPPQALGNGTGGIGVIVDGRERDGYEAPLNDGVGNGGAIRPLGRQSR